jgi:hypothetical protein
MIGGGGGGGGSSRSCITGRIISSFSFGALDSLARLVVKDELPFISVSWALFACSNALPTMRQFMVALYRERVSKLTEQTGGDKSK